MATKIDLNWSKKDSKKEVEKLADLIKDEVDAKPVRQGRKRISKKDAAITMSISTDDRAKFTGIAYQHGISMSDLLHQWIEKEYKRHPKEYAEGTRRAEEEREMQAAKRAQKKLDSVATTAI